MKDLLNKLVPVPAKSCLTGGSSRWIDLVEERQVVRDLGQEGYRLRISEGCILIEAATDNGFFLASRTLQQMKMLSPASCPFLQIEDEPVLNVRGYMLDISRCKVPKMEQLFRLVDLLALFKFNQLQLYTEHTFAYTRHREVWSDASPMTANEVKQLKVYCAERFIELVPNQNAFGHMERWLKHETYKNLAESPDGFHHPITGWRPSGTVLYPDENSIQLIDGLLDELLPCFESDWVHLGCDEPWELGQGRSSDKAEEVGRHQVFKEYVTELHALLSKRNKQMLFWSDELRENPHRIRDFPEDIVPVVWGYESDHPFDEECGIYSELDHPFLIAPGDSSWNSFSGRIDNARANIKRASKSAVRHGALGMLLTSWGDNGHQQVWPAQLSGIILFSAASWNPEKMDVLSLANSLNCFIFEDEKGGLGAFWEALGQIDSHIPLRIIPENSSFPFDALYQPSSKIHHAFNGHSQDCLFKALSLLDHCKKQLTRTEPSCEDAQWLIDESQLAYDQTFAGLKRAEAILKGKMSLLETIDCNAIIKNYQQTWLLRNRKGGLMESLERMKHCPNGLPPVRTN